MINKIKIILGIILALGLVFKPIQCNAIQSLAIIVLAVFGFGIALDGLMKIEG